MAFCTSCGETVDANAKFCTKCGATLASGFTPVAGAGGTAAAPAQAAQVPPSGGGGALKVILIVIGVFVFVCVLAFGAIAYFGYRAAKTIKQAAGSVQVQAVTSGEDAKRLVEKLGIEVYPGATFKRAGGSSVAIGGMRVAGATFETSDPASQVADWYRTKYANSMSADNEGSHTLTFANNNAWVTIGIQETGGKTEISISSVEGGKGRGATAPDEEKGGPETE